MPGNPFYQTAAWKEARRNFLRASPVCAVPGCTKKATHVDHRISIRRGGAPLDPSNFQGFCHSHHNAKTNMVDGGWGGKVHVVDNLMPRLKGCDADGNPLDPTHHWNKRR